MAITSYEELKTAVSNWLHRTDLNTLIPDFIALGETRIYRDLRIRAMETSIDSAIAGGVVALPSGYVELKHAYIDGTPIRKLTRKNAEWIYQNYPTRAADGNPLFVAVDGGNFIFGPYPDSTYTMKGTYYKRLEALSDSNTTNWFMANSPDILLFSALHEAADYVRDNAMMAQWDAKYQRAKDRIQYENDAEAFSGSVLSVTKG